MALASYISTCLHTEIIANEIYELRFSKPDDLQFTAGQFVMWDVPALDDSTDIQPRAYSIASRPSDEDLLFVVKYEKGGRASEWVKQQLQVGTEVRMQGPLGVLTLNTESKKEPLFVCTSTGNAPFRSILLEALENGDQRRMDLIFGVRTEEDLYWLEEFHRLTHEYGNFFFHPTVSQPTENWKGHKGRVQALFGHISKDFSNKLVYACGNPDMTTEVKNICLQELGMEKKDVHVEGYI